MKPDPNSTHPMNPIDPQRFRAQAVGIGQTRRASEMTGMMREQRAVDMPGCTKACAPAREGFPQSTTELMAAQGLPGTGAVLATKAGGL